MRIRRHEPQVSFEEASCHRRSLEFSPPRTPYLARESAADGFRIADDTDRITEDCVPGAPHRVLRATIDEENHSCKSFGVSMRPRGLILANLFDRLVHFSQSFAAI